MTVFHISVPPSNIPIIIGATIGVCIFLILLILAVVACMRSYRYMFKLANYGLSNYGFNCLCI